MAKYLNTLEEYSTDPKREKEFIEWYENMHSHDILETPGFQSARLWGMKEPREGRGRFLSTYEIESDDIEKTIGIRRKNRDKERAAGRYDPAMGLFIVLWRDVTWKLITERFTKKEIRKAQKWACLVDTYCLDASREKEFTNWYDDVLMPDELETAGFASARRYERKEFVGGRGQYLGMYEVFTDDIDKTMKERLERLDKMKEKGKYSELCKVVWQDVLWKLLIERTIKNY